MQEDENTELLSRVGALRAAGSGPKQIARALGLRPAHATALIRRVAQVEQAGTAPGQRPLVGAWVNAGWSRGLDLTEVPNWAVDDSDVDENAVGSGFAQLLFARRERASKVTVCGLLVDVYCLGIKDVVPARTIGEGSLDAHRRSYYSAFDLPPRSIGADQAQAIVYGAVAYARELGFEPAEGFDEAAQLLGAAHGSAPGDRLRQGRSALLHQRPPRPCPPDRRDPGAHLRQGQLPLHHQHGAGVSGCCPPFSARSALPACSRPLALGPAKEAIRVEALTSGHAKDSHMARNAPEQLAALLGGRTVGWGVPRLNSRPAHGLGLEVAGVLSLSSAEPRRLVAMNLRLSTVILPVDRWHEGGRATWQAAEELGFHAAYTYDHLSWRSFRDRPGSAPCLP